jgi:hypothetical protein
VRGKTDVADVAAGGEAPLGPADPCADPLVDAVAGTEISADAPAGTIRPTPPTVRTTFPRLALTIAPGD